MLLQKIGLYIVYINTGFHEIIITQMSLFYAHSENTLKNPSAENALLE